MSLLCRPVHIHDSDCCRYMMTVTDKYGYHDIYVCRTCISSLGAITLLARHSDEPSDYSSSDSRIFLTSIRGDIGWRDDNGTYHRMPYRQWMFQRDANGEYANGAFRVAWLQILEEEGLL